MGLCHTCYTSNVETMLAGPTGTPICVECFGRGRQVA